MNAHATLMLDPGWSDRWELKPVNVGVDLPDVAVRRATRVPMWVFVAPSGARVISTRPVEVEVDKEGPDEESPVSAYVFSCKKLHVFASASTYDAAEDSFHEQVVYFFHSYRDLAADEVDDDAAEIRELYARHFVETSAPGR